MDWTKERKGEKKREKDRQKLKLDTFSFGFWMRLRWTKFKN